MIRTIPLLGAATLALAACNNMSSVSGAPVRVAQASQVAQCKYVIDLTDTPGMYGALATQGQDYARKMILDDAARAGANTVVFDKVDPGGMVTEVKATAYSCPG